jgi:hypothetical protein
MNFFRDGLGVHALVDLNRLFGRVADHPTIRTFGDVTLELAPEFHVDFLVLVEIIVEFGQELSTGKQKRRPLSF